jgi:hypothetical protein
MWGLGGIVDCGLWIGMAVFVEELVFLVEVLNLSLLSYILNSF